MSTTARLSVLEQAVDRLASSRGPRVSTTLRQARARAMAGEPAPMQVYDVAELERRALGRGLAADMARSRLRIARGFAPEALLPVWVSAQDGHGEAGGTETPASVATRSAGSAAHPTATSERDLLLARIDATLARANGHV